MNSKSRKNFNYKNRSGFAIFVALGAIVVLTILIVSYNMLVRGKSHERQSILNHTRALKAAQGTARYIFARMKQELGDKEAGTQIREAFINEDASLLNNYLNEIEYKKIYKDICNLKNTSLNIEAKVEFDDVDPLSKYGKGNEVYLPYEKAGIIKIALKASINNSNETWEEIRPFRVALPFPIGLTKFTLYLSKPINNPLAFNRVMVTNASGGGVVGDKVPLIVDNGSSISDNKDPNIWKLRGWIYLGNGSHFLNRADGDTAYGQQYHSYIPGSIGPKAIPEHIDGIYNHETGFTDINGREIHVSSARWGFSQQTVNEPSWQQVLNDEKLFSSKPRYYSTWLHLFGDINCTQNIKSSGYRKDQRIPSITRIVGNVYDRFLQVAYLGTCENPIEIIGAVKNFSEEDFNIVKSSPVLEEILILSSGSPLLKESDEALENFREAFKEMPYKPDSSDLAYLNIMSKVNNNVTYRDVYASIAQYTTDRVLDTPPGETFYKDLPAMGDDNFKLEIPGHDESIKPLPAISALGTNNNNDYGLSSRITYEIKTSNPVETFKKVFCKGGKYDLQNAVIHIKTNETVNLDAVTIESGGTIICDKSINLGQMQKAPAERPPVLFVSKDGNINLSGHTEAYLMAPSGMVNGAGSDKTIDVFGGIAAARMEQSQGFLTYNPAFDPTNEHFISQLGVVLGPEGEKK